MAAAYKCIKGSLLLDSIKTALWDSSEFVHLIMIRLDHLDTYSLYSLKCVELSCDHLVCGFTVQPGLSS